MAGTDPEAEADHEMLKESNKKFTKHLSDEKKHMYDFIILETHTHNWPIDVHLITILK